MLHWHHGCRGGTGRARPLFFLVAFAVAGTAVAVGQHIQAVPMEGAHGVVYVQQGLDPVAPHVKPAGPLHREDEPFPVSRVEREPMAGPLAKRYLGERTTGGPVGVDTVEKASIPAMVEVANMKPPKVKLRGLFTLLIGLLFVAIILKRGGAMDEQIGGLQMAFSFAAMGLLELAYSLYMRHVTTQQFDMAKFVVMNAQPGKRRDIILSNLARPHAPVKPVAAHVMGFFGLLLAAVAVAAISAFLTQSAMIAVLKVAIVCLLGAVMAGIIQKVGYFIERKAWKWRSKRYNAKAKGTTT